MPQREYSTAQTIVAKATKRITLPIELATYNALAEHPDEFRSWLDSMIARYPELFPPEIGEGYVLHDRLPASTKLPAVRFRRIRLQATAAAGAAQVFTIASSDVLPSMTGYASEVEKALFLRRFGVPFWGLTYVFGRNDAYWYRLTASLGRYDLVDTTVKAAECLPDHLLADEKHVHFNGTKGYIATTVGADCVLGASLALAADDAGLAQAYGRFHSEAQGVDPEYAPQTVNTDGWTATQNAWRTLFPTIVIIECFLHAFLRIRERCQRLKDTYREIERQVWDTYHAADASDFRRRLQDLHTWALQTVTGTALEAIQKLCAKGETFALAYAYPQAHRTSNMVDRHMDPLDRWLCSARYFHGDWSAAERQIRAWALLHNFWPYCPRAQIGQRFVSPVHQLNGSLYHENWLHNLLISTSATGLNAYHRIR